MNNSKKRSKFLKFSLMLGLIIFSFYTLDAQPTGPGTSPTPFGFLEAMILAGAAYGGKEYLKKRKSNI